MSEWYVFAESGDHVGPVTAELIARGILAGKVPRDARVARDAPAGWLDVRDASEVVAALDDLSESTKTTQHQALSKDVPEPPATNRDLEEATPGSEPDPTEVHRRDQIGIPKKETVSSKPPPPPRSSSKLPAAPASVRAPIPAAGAPPAPPTQPLGTSGPPSGLALPNLGPKGSPPSKPRVSTSAPPPSAPLLSTSAPPPSAPLLSSASPAAPAPASPLGLAPKAATLVASPPPAPPQAPPPSQIPAPLSAAPPVSTQVTGPPPPVVAPAMTAPAAIAAIAPIAPAPVSLAPSVPPPAAKEEKKDDKPKPPPVDRKMQLLVPLLSFGFFAVLAVLVAIYALVTKSYAR